MRDPEADLRRFTVDDLAICCGNLPTENENLNRYGFKSSQVLLSANGEVYEATSHPTGRDFYGKGKPYNVFAGCDSTLALARVQINRSLCNTWNWDSLNSTERKTLAEWILKFRTKYKYVGLLQEAEKCHLDLSVFNCVPYSI